MPIAFYLNHTLIRWQSELFLAELATLSLTQIKIHLDDFV